MFACRVSPVRANLLTLRGGSWINNPENASCSYRNRNLPDNSNNNAGVRVVLSIALSPVRSANHGAVFCLV